MNIAIYNHKGGVGKTTFTLHLAYMSMSENKNNVIVDLDRQKNTIETLSNGEYSPSIELFEKGSLKITSNINILQDLDYDKAIIDTPPAFEVVERMHKHVDKWIVPIDGRNSVIGTLNFLQEAKSFQINNENIMIVMNKVYDNRPISRTEKKEVEKIGYKLFELPIYDSDVFRRAESFAKAVWDVPYGIRSKATQNMQVLCRTILNW